MAARIPKVSTAEPAVEAGALAASALFPIVGVGASAGGLEAFTQMLGAQLVERPGKRTVLRGIAHGGQGIEQLLPRSCNDRLALSAVPPLALRKAAVGLPLPWKACRGPVQVLAAPGRETGAGRSS